ncbi:NADH:flavin oxidoreductase/NADH oxidase [Candidatus Pantoea bituminis]|uniref:NADH:flavin oxidoreductase/NADH oxidase n=1 Tax=Candidatus Pantoea bituminis TaxID=2831036 RepID=UPI001C06452B|nr:NADH:flavin oxidoreductase/NADH oxidase [Pantoea bituminis]
MEAALFTPFKSRGIVIPNRIVVSPMGQYAAEEGVANDWHLTTYGKYAQGRAGLVMMESVAVTSDGRGTWGDVGLWNEQQTAALARIATFIGSQDGVPAIQLHHAGRKAAVQRPWEGMKPLASLPDAGGKSPWKVAGPSPVPYVPDAVVPHELTSDEIENILTAFVQAAERAVKAGFRVIELHAAHGFLLHQFLSPLSNRRNDQWGGDSTRRMAFPLEVIRRVRAALPDDLPLWLRVSVTDDAEGGRTFDDTLEFTREAARNGVDLIDCSNGGFAAEGKHGIKRDFGYLVPYAQAVREQNNIPVMAVGLITDARQADNIIQHAKADLVAIGRELIYNPNWPLHAAETLQGDSFSRWPPAFGWWLEKEVIR